MKIKNITLILISIVLFVFSHYSIEWSKDFVDPCCSGNCGRCPPSMWECNTMNYMGMIQMLIGIGILMSVVFNYFDEGVI